MHARIVAIGLVVLLVLTACGDGGTPDAAPATTGEPATTAPTTAPPQTASATTEPPPTTTAAATTSSPTTQTSTEVMIEGDGAFIAHTENALALLEEKAPDDYAVVVSAIDTIRSVPAGSGMDVFTKTYKVGEQTAYAPGYPESAQVDWYAGTIVHDACHSVLYQEGKEFTGRDAELACLEKQLAALELIENGGVFQPYIASLIEGVDDPDNAYWTNPNRHW